jgi:hypothetical protein
MRAMLLFLCVAVALVIATISKSRGEGGATDSSAIAEDDTTEPITGKPVMPFKGSETPMKDPFSPYGIGGSEAAWKYEDLTRDEKAVADRGLNEDQAAVQDAYAAAAKGLAARAKSESAAIQLGIDMQLENIGVVPETTGEEEAP